MELFPDEESARLYLEQRRWKGSPTCPECNSLSVYARKKKRAGMYDCRECGKHFSLRTGSIFEKSPIKLNKWIYALYAAMTSRNGISSMQLSTEIGVTQKTAWFMLQRIREACNGGSTEMFGIDGINIGVSDKNRHESKKLNAKRSGVGKQALDGKRQAYLKLTQ